MDFFPCECSKQESLHFQSHRKIVEEDVQKISGKSPKNYLESPQEEEGEKTVVKNLKRYVILEKKTYF